MSLPDVPSRKEAIRAHREAGGEIAAVYPIHYPRALLRAFGLLPVEVWGPPSADTASGDAHLQAYTCSIVRCGLSFALDGGLDGADVVVVPHACDSLQGLASVLIDFVGPTAEVVPIYIPRGQRASDADFFTAELQSTYDRLAVATGRAPTLAELSRAVHREEQADALLRQLHDARDRFGASDRDFYRFVRSREYLPAEWFSDLARRALAAAGKAEATGIPVVISGIVPEPMDVLDVLEAAGGRIVGDDFASCGRRLYPAGTSAEPLRRMAEGLLNAPPDPTRGSPIAARVTHLHRLAVAGGARGVVFYTVKFCEPELFDLPLVTKGLEAAGIRSVTIEADIGDRRSHQLATRLEAFLEMVA